MGSVYKGELATNASQSAPPSAMNVTGARPVTNTGAISPSTTNVSTTHTAVGIAPLGGIVHHAKDVPLGRVRGGRSSPYRTESDSTRAVGSST